MNKTLHPIRSAATLVCGLLLASAALAHGDEDHSAPTANAQSTLLPPGNRVDRTASPAAPTANAQSTLLPRIGVTTEEFELVAVLEPGRLLIHVDFADSNQPVPQAQLDVEGAGANTSATELAPGLFSLSLSQPLAAGSHALTFTIQTPESGDLIAAKLDVPPAIAAQSQAVVPAATKPWPWLAGGAGVALAGMSLAFMRRRSGAGVASNPRDAK